MILRYQLGGEEMPGMAANKIRGYCERILSTLQDNQKVAMAFQIATAVIDSLTNGTENRDTVKTQAFTDSVLTEMKKSH